MNLIDKCVKKAGKTYITFQLKPVTVYDKPWLRVVLGIRKTEFGLGEVFDHVQKPGCDQTGRSW